MNEQECGSGFQYEDGPKFTCMLPAGHKGPHCSRRESAYFTWTPVMAMASGNGGRSTLMGQADRVAPRWYILVAAIIYRVLHPGAHKGCRHTELMTELDRVRRLGAGHGN